MKDGLNTATRAPKLLTLTFLGTSSGVPTKSRNVSGLAFQVEGQEGWCLLDAGEGTQHRIAQAKLSLRNLEVIFVTHVHGDHCYGLPGIIASAGMAGKSTPLTIVAPGPAQEWLRSTIRLTDLRIPYELKFVNSEENESVWRTASVNVTSHALDHRVDSYAYRVSVVREVLHLDSAALKATGLPAGPLWSELKQGRDVDWAGKRLRGQDYQLHVRHRAVAVLGGDNARPEVLRDECAGAHLLVHEATFTQAALDRVGPLPKHSSAAMVAHFAQSASLPNLILTHFSPRHHDEKGQAELEAEAKQAYAGHLWLANDLDRFEVHGGGGVARA